MLSKRSWMGLGVLAALACQQASASEPAPMMLKSASSPYHAREAGANGGGSDTTPSIAPVVVGTGSYDAGCGAGYGCGNAYSPAGPGVNPPPIIGHFAVPYALRADPVRAVSVETGETLASFARQGRPVLSRINTFISTGESPQPQTRAYLRYDYLEIKGQFPRPSPLVDKIRIETATLGLEKSLWNDHASIGIRVPFYKTEFSLRTINDGGFIIDLDESLDEDYRLADITLIAKCSSGNFARTGKVCTIGLAAMLPTGEGLESFDVNTGLALDKHVGLLQPFLGYAFSWNEIFVQGFSSVLFPLRAGTSDDAILWHNSLAVGCWVYGGADCGGGHGHGHHFAGLLGDGMITAIVPTLEFQINSPLSNGGQFDYFRDPAEQDAIFVASGHNMQFLETFVITAGVNVGVSDCGWVTVGASIPLTKEPFDYQLTVQGSVRF